MKVSPKADYPVQVVNLADDEPAVQAPHYAGIYSVVLNHEVQVEFVPDVSATAPPWDELLLPANLDLVTTAEQARLETVLFARYAVTPHARLAGEAESTGAHRRTGWVRYVAPAEFDRYALELARLNQVAWEPFSGPTVSGLLGYEVIRFIAEQIVAAPWLDPSHAMMLGRG